MFNVLIVNGIKTPLYYHKTDGGAAYLTDTFIEDEEGHREGSFEKANNVIRIDGGELDILKLAALSTEEGKKQMKEMTVTWQVNLNADTPLEAAEAALKMQRDRTSIATVFDVREEDDTITRVDLQEGTQVPVVDDTYNVAGLGGN